MTESTEEDLEQARSLVKAHLLKEQVRQRQLEIEQLLYRGLRDGHCSTKDYDAKMRTLAESKTLVIASLSSPEDAHLLEERLGLKIRDLIGGLRY